MRVQVKYGPQSLDLELPDGDGATVLALQSAIEQQTGVFQRKQKVIHKGKVISCGGDDKLAGKTKLAEVGVGDGAKLMLMATDGSVATQVGAAWSL